jgi:hypothetical protein
MKYSLVVCATAIAALPFALPTAVDAQSFETVGIRAQGMGGAFVAVADDPDAAWWNPAGLAVGSLVGATVAYGTAEEPASPSPDAAAWRSNARTVVVAYPALAISYYRVQVSERSAQGSAAGGVAGREDPGSGRRLDSLVLSQYGASFGQSFTEHFVVASTLKLVSGRFAAVSSIDSVASLDQADGLRGPSSTQFDIDLGALAIFGPARFGASLRNLRKPSFANGSDHADLQRQARIGACLRAGPKGGNSTATLAFDADLTRTRTATGEARHVAAGAEGWLLRGRLGVRGGISVNTLGSASAVPSVGISVGVSRRTYLEWSSTSGSDERRRGWGAGLRATF